MHTPEVTGWEANICSMKGHQLNQNAQERTRHGRGEGSQGFWRPLGPTSMLQDHPYRKTQLGYEMGLRGKTWQNPRPRRPWPTLILTSPWTLLFTQGCLRGLGWTPPSSPLFSYKQSHVERPQAPGFQLPTNFKAMTHPWPKRRPIWASPPLVPARKHPFSSLHIPRGALP